MTDTRDRLIADAKSLPDLVAKAQRFDPALAQQLTGKVLLASKTPWGVLVSGAVGWAVSRYGLGWDGATTDLVAGAAVVLGAYAMRKISSGPITGLFRRAAG